uniref:Uncharacterized protein n=1 Tax=Arundo donax TaxID=35708 RepID=A0A0A9FFH4_ARUDO
MTKKSKKSSASSHLDYMYIYFPYQLLDGKYAWRVTAWWIQKKE